VTKKLTLLAWCSVATVGLLVTGGARAYLERDTDTGKEQFKEVFLVPPGRVLRQLDLGYHSLAGDLLFIKANLYYGTHLLTDEQVPWLNNFIDVLLEVDPDFKAAYFWAALSTINRKRSNTFVVDEFVAHANAILDRGMARFPDDYRFPMRIGFNHYYEMGDLEKALPYLERAALIPGAPTWLREKLVDIYNRKGQRALAAQILSDILSETDDPVLTDAMRGRLAVSLDKAERDEIARFRKKLLQEWQGGYGFVPLDLYLLLREPQHD
jgi:hypothetical protein